MVSKSVLSEGVSHHEHVVHPQTEGYKGHYLSGGGIEGEMEEWAESQPGHHAQGNDQHTGYADAGVGLHGIAEIHQGEHSINEL